MMYVYEAAANGFWFISFMHKSKHVIFKNGKRARENYCNIINGDLELKMSVNIL